jgi:hypothetical protein
MHEEMGDRKPSQFLRHLKSLAPDVPDDFLRSIWSSRLPSHIQAILAGQAEGNLDSASQLADRISEVAPQPTAAYVSPACDNANLIQRIDELSRQVASLTVNRPRHRSHSRARRNSDETLRREDGTAEPNLCWYHRRFGEKAQKCTAPCSFRQPENSNNRR